MRQKLAIGLHVHCTCWKTFVKGQPSLQSNHRRLSNMSWSQNHHYYQIHALSFPAPLSAVLTRRIPIRYVQLIGACLSSIGVFMCGMATTEWEVMILFSVVTGWYDLLCWEGGRLLILALKYKSKEDHSQIYTRTKQPDACRDLILALCELTVELYTNHILFSTPF